MPGAIVAGCRERREALGLMKGQLAKQAGVSDRVVQSVEAGATCEPREAERLETVLSAAVVRPVVDVESVVSGTPLCCRAR